MVLKTALAALCILLPSAAPAQEPGSAGEVKLPLREYLALMEKVDASLKRQAQKPEAPEPVVSQVTSQSTRIVVGEDQASVGTSFDVELRGKPTVPVDLPLTGLADTIRVKPAGTASVGRSAAGLRFVSPEPGQFNVTVEGTVPLVADTSVTRIELAPTLAPVAITEIDLDASLGWSCAGSVTAGDVVNGARRVVRLALGRGAPHVFELKRELKGTKAEDTLAQAVVVTLINVRPDTVQRHDVSLYEVSRGRLSTLSARLPEGLEVERLAIDEGEVPPVVDAGMVTVARKTTLTGTGYLVVTSSAAGEDLSLLPVLPDVQVRARYLAVAGAAAFEAEPGPAGAWSRVDMTDLPTAVVEASPSLQLTAAWRLKGEPDKATLRVKRLPAARELPTLVSSRETTTLLTVDGTLLHRDRLRLKQAGGSLDVALPEGFVLWSVLVNSLAVRPVMRETAASVPLPFGARPGTIVEVVAVQDRAVPQGRSDLEIEALGVHAPVLEHSWRLLLPENAKYRLVKSDLAQAAPPPPPVAQNVYGQVMNDVPIARRYESAIQMESGVAGGVEGGMEGAGNSTLRGRVTDADGAVLPGATVTISSPRYSPRTRQTDSVGAFSFGNLPEGPYDIRVEMEGFSPQVRSGLRLAVNQRMSLEINLMLSGIAESVAGIGDSPLVDTSASNRTYSATSVGEAGAGSAAQAGGSSGGKRKARKAEEAYEQSLNAQQYQQEAAQLRQDLHPSLGQGATGGVRPITVSVPESGKLLFLAGALPPARVTVALEVKKKP